MATKQELLNKLFEARDKAFKLEVEHQMAEWEAEKAYKAYIECLRTEKGVAANG